MNVEGLFNFEFQSLQMTIVTARHNVHSVSQHVGFSDYVLQCGSWTQGNGIYGLAVIVPSCHVWF
jgi:hypothetical protein